MSVVNTKSVIAGVQGALPPLRYTQEEVTEAFIGFPGFGEYEKIIRQLHASSKVSYRHLVLPLEKLAALTDFGEANEIATAVLFLAAPGSAYVTGAVISVDGGWMAR